MHVLYFSAWRSNFGGNAIIMIIISVLCFSKLTPMYSRGTRVADWHFSHCNEQLNLILYVLNTSI